MSATVHGGENYNIVLRKEFNEVCAQFMLYI